MREGESPRHPRHLPPPEQLTKSSSPSILRGLVPVTVQILPGSVNWGASARGARGRACAPPPPPEKLREVSTTGVSRGKTALGFRIPGSGFRVPGSGFRGGWTSGAAECDAATHASTSTVQWFRGGLVFEAHRLLYHST